MANNTLYGYRNSGTQIHQLMLGQYFVMLRGIVSAIIRNKFSLIGVDASWLSQPHFTRAQHRFMPYSSQLTS